MAGHCRPGDVLSVIAGDFVVVGSGPCSRWPPTSWTGCWPVAAKLVTVVAGADDPEVAGDAVRQVRRAAPPVVDVVVATGARALPAPGVRQVTGVRPA